MPPAERSSADATDLSPAILEQIASAIAGIRYGAVEVVIHDARVVQIERRERLRLQGGEGSAPRRWTG